jgi:hypothetical protein
MVELGQEPEREAFTPASVERVFAQVHRLFTLARRAADAEEPAPSEEGFAIIDTLNIGRDRPRRVLPLEVRRVYLGSPLEVVVAVSGAFATPQVIRYLIDIIGTAFILKARIHRDRAQLEAEELAAQVETLRSKQELVRLAAGLLQSVREPLIAHAPQPASVDLWVGDADDPPELELGDDPSPSFGPRG